MAGLALKGVRKSFGTVAVIHGIDLAIADGASNEGFATVSRARFGTGVAPRNTIGSCCVNAIESRVPSTCARRFRNPDWKSRAPCSGWPSSMPSCVSKWLRDTSCVPAKGTKAACRRS